MNWKSLAVSSALALTALAGSSDQAQAQNLTFDVYASGFNQPLYICSPPGDASRQFVVEKVSGQIKIIKNGVTLPTPFLDVGAISSSSGEQGLLGLAFHPDYFVSGAAGEGMFCINYTNNSGDTVVRSYLVSANPDVADPASFTTLITIGQPFSNHNGGCVQFGPDKLLYIGMGDGGSGNDPGNRAQNPLQLLGKMLRLDPTLPAPHVPASNPFVGNAGTLDEIWALGMRNPWRFSFDRQTGDLWIADVGQNAIEEVDFEPAGSAGGLNYGWRCMEGLNCTGLSGCTCNAPSLVLPVDQYTHSGGNCSISGGYMYRGSLMPGMVGRYFFADLCSDNLWSIAWDGSVASDRVNHKTDIGLPGSVQIVSFGEDAAGELFVVDIAGGRIFLLKEECVGTAVPYCIGASNSTGNPGDLAISGSLSIGDNTMSMLATGLPTGIPGLFFYGPNQTQVPFGDGFRCVSGQVFRMPPVEFTDLFGFAIRDVDFNTFPTNSGPGQILPGSNWNFQFWYRDIAAGGAGFNLTNGVSVTFCP